MSKNNVNKVYSAFAISYIIENAGVKSAGNIAKKLKRTVKGVRRKAEKLGISLRVN